MTKPRLRILAVSAPHWPKRPDDVVVRSLTAATPFSLQNAVRQAAGLAASGSTVWSDSNWVTFEGRRSSVLLYEFFDEVIVDFKNKLNDLKPNLLLIGAMTLGMPGAVELARVARQQLGDDCLVVIGGKHCNETLRTSSQGVQVHQASPLALMCDGTIPKEADKQLFDIVVSGEAEELISVIGELLYQTIEGGGHAVDVLSNLEGLRKARGKWVVGSVVGTNLITIKSNNDPLDFLVIPTSPSLFGLQSAFDIFDNVPTGHAYSDMGMGCRYNCFFCSERVDVSGNLRKDYHAAERLLLHLEDIWRMGGHGERGPIGVFIEDAVLLGGVDQIIKHFIDEYRKNIHNNLRIGCQMTVNDVDRLSKNGLLEELSSLGFDYVAFGMETVNESLASKMSKHKKGGLWVEQNRRALKSLCKANMRAGLYILWGLGESIIEREAHLSELANWKDEFDGQPCAIGLNWATLHPAAFGSKHSGHDFLKWGTASDSKRLKYFVEIFGEASETYPLLPNELPEIEELELISRKYSDLWCN